MKSIEKFLSGIGFILFGIACLLMLELANWGLFWVLGFTMPFAGITIIVINIYSKESPTKEMNK